MQDTQLAKMGIIELRELAKEKGIKSVQKYKKAELIELLTPKEEKPTPKRGRPKSKNNENVYMSRTENNRIVHFESETDYTGQFINIKITRGDTFALYGEI